MARLIQNYSIQIDAEPMAVYDYLADLTRHGEWSDGLNVEAVSEGPTKAGSEFRSTGRMMGKEFSNDITVVESRRPTRLTFTATDGNGKYKQEIDLSANKGGTLLRRRVSTDMNPMMLLGFKALLGPLVAKPSMNKSLKKLKARLEES